MNMEVALRLTSIDLVSLTLFPFHRGGALNHSLLLVFPDFRPMTFHM